MTVWSEMKLWTAKDRENGKCPVGRGELVRCFCEDGESYTGFAAEFIWKKGAAERSEIIGYQVEVKPDYRYLPITDAAIAASFLTAMDFWSRDNITGAIRIDINNLESGGVYLTADELRKEFDE